MENFDVIAKLNSDDKLERKQAIGEFWVRFNTKLVKVAFRHQESKAHSGTSKVSPEDVVLDLFAHFLHCAENGQWPGERELPPWKTEGELFAYFVTSIKNRCLSESVSGNVMVDSLAVEKLLVPGNYCIDGVIEKEEFEDAIKFVHQELSLYLKERHFLVMKAISDELILESVDASMADVHEKVAKGLNLGSRGYVSNCWSECLKVVKRISGKSKTTEATEFLLMAIRHPHFATINYPRAHSPQRV